MSVTLTTTITPSARTVDARQHAASAQAHAIASALIDAAGISDSVSMTARWRDLTAKVGVAGANTILHRELAQHGIHYATFIEVHGARLPGFAPGIADPETVREFIARGLPAGTCCARRHRRCLTEDQAPIH